MLFGVWRLNLSPVHGAQPHRTDNLVTEIELPVKQLTPTMEALGLCGPTPAFCENDIRDARHLIGDMANPLHIHLGRRLASHLRIT